MKKIHFILLAGVIFILTSCSRKSNYVADSGTDEKSPAYYEETHSTEKQQSEKNMDTAGRKVIKKGDIVFETADIAKTKEKVRAQLKEVNAYLASENENALHNRVQCAMVIRVPAANFDKLIQMIGEDAESFESRNIEINDVTEEYVDVEARIKSKKELEASYLALLKQAKSMNDILSIQKHLGGIREEIEAMEGKFKYLNDRITFSTLTLTFYEKTPHKTSFSGKFGNAFKNGWQSMIWFFVGLTYIWPFIIFVAIVVIVILVITKRKRRKSGK